MKSETGFDPIECEKGNVDFEIGRKCFEASKKALPKLKEIAKDYPEVQRMVSKLNLVSKEKGNKAREEMILENFSASKRDPAGARTSRNVSLIATTRLTGRSAFLSAPSTKFSRGVKRWKDIKNTTTLADKDKGRDRVRMFRGHSIR